MSQEPLQSDVVVVGAGVVGLAIAQALADRSRTVILLDQHSKFGQETSSRNSEVLHSGIYYPKSAMKTAWCIAGRKALIEFAQKNQVPYEQCGKLVIATNGEEKNYLEKLSLHCTDLGISHSFQTAQQVQEKEPLVKATAALYFSESGIVDSHALMARLEKLFLERGGICAYRHRVQYIERNSNAWKLSVQVDGSHTEINTDILINAAGLGAALLSNQALQTKIYEHRFCRGRYFSLSSRFQGAFQRLIYPVPQKDGLGVHVTLDLNGNSRLGPDVEWCDVPYDKVDRLYDCDWESLSPSFLQAVQKYCPTVGASDIAPGLIGIRPKLFVSGQAHPDFLVENRDGFIHCLGIESPGLTASLAIADKVKMLQS